VTPKQLSWWSGTRSIGEGSTGTRRRRSRLQDVDLLPNILARHFLATSRPPSSIRVTKSPCAGLFDGRYWARTSDPQLVDRPARVMRGFAGLALIARTPLRTLEKRLLTPSRRLSPADTKSELCAVQALNRHWDAIEGSAARAVLIRRLSRELASPRATRDGIAWPCSHAPGAEPACEPLLDRTPAPTSVAPVGPPQRPRSHGHARGLEGTTSSGSDGCSVPITSETRAGRSARSR
jgi:hypothetical protein